MRYLPKLFLLILIGALAVTLNMGCSNNNSTNVGVTAGDTTSTSYQSAKEAFGVMYDSLTTNFNRGMEYQDGFNPPPRAASTTDTVYTGYDSTTGWWYYYEDGQDDYGEYVIADSVRYWAESTYQRNPDEFTDRMELKFNAEVVYDGLLYMAIISEDDWEFTISADTIGIDGTGEFIFDFSDSIGSISYDQEFDGIKFLENASHPHTGEMSVNMDVTAYNEETGQMDSATFTLEVTFYEEYMHIYMSDGTYYWEWDEYYDQG